MVEEKKKEKKKHQQAVNQALATACHSSIELVRGRMGVPGTLRGERRRRCWRGDGGSREEVTVCLSRRLKLDLIFDSEHVAFECKSILIVSPSDRVKRNL